MGALLPLLAAAAPAATTALMVGAARGVGGVLGKAAGNQIVETAGDIKDAITSIGQPKNAGQQRVVYIAGQPYLAN